MNLAAKLIRVCIRQINLMHDVNPQSRVQSLKIMAKDVASVVSLAALYVVLSILPGFPVIGVEGAKIGLVSIVVPVFGLLVGPWLGVSSAFLGGVVSRVLFGASAFTWLTLPAMPLSAFMAGCLSREKVGFLRGWLVAALILGGLILVWYGTWIGQRVPVFPLLHWVALAIILIFRGWLAYFIQGGEKTELYVCVALCGFAATMATHLYGNLAFILASELVIIKSPLLPVFFFSLIPVATAERLIITAITSILGTPVLLAFRRQI